MENLQNFIFISASTLGFISLCYSLFKLFNWVWIMFLRPPKNLRKYGSWALITGCTSGIGKSLALELASKGLNLILVGRNRTKLESIATLIRELNGEKKIEIEIRSIVIDFASVGGVEIAKLIQLGVEGLDLGVVINNVGLSYPYAKFFHEIDSELMEGLIEVNVKGATWVTRAVLPGMLERKRGAVVNIGSGSSGVVSSYPLYAVYAATKAYIAMFSKCLSVEYKQHGIDIQCQVPLLVATKMASIRQSSLFIPSPETFSRASIRWIGYEQICIPYWPHYLQWCMADLLPEMIQDWCILKYFLGMRKRGLRKDSMNAKAK